MSGSQYSTADTADPLITIAIPTRNRAPLVKNCVSTALAQTYPNIEVLVSDNASTDDTLATLRSVKDERLRVFANSENLGIIGNFNNCIREAKGDYIVLISDDNVLNPTFLEKCVRLIRMEPGIPIVLGAYDILVLDEFSKNERRRVPPLISKKLSTGIWDGTEILKEYLHGRISAQTLSSVIRTDILRRNGGYSKEYTSAADEGLWIPVLLEGRAGLINECCATYLIHDANFSAGVAADDRLNDVSKVMKEVSAVAERKISDRATRRQIQRLTWRYLAFQVMITLVVYRRAGASLIDVGRRLWNWRTMLKQCTLIDFMTTLRIRSIGRILLPTPLVRWSIALRLDRLF
jgi:glycosyltransferase involved in cell wall biosynthesis